MSRYAGRLPTTYAEAEKALRGRQVRTIVNNTRASRRDKDTVEVQYHGNTIATFHADGRREFTTCGWGTVSTHERLNAMVPYGVGFVRRDYAGQVQVRHEGEFVAVPADTVRLAADDSIIDITKEH